MGILDREITGSGISRVGVSGVNFRDPTKSLVDTIAGMQNRKLVEDRQRLAQANADRTFGLQESNAARQAQQDEYNMQMKAAQMGMQADRDMSAAEYQQAQLGLAKDRLNVAKGSRTDAANERIRKQNMEEGVIAGGFLPVEESTTTSTVKDVYDEEKGRNLFNEYSATIGDKPASKVDDLKLYADYLQKNDPDYAKKLSIFEKEEKARRALGEKVGQQIGTTGVLPTGNVFTTAYKYGSQMFGEDKSTEDTLRERIAGYTKPEKPAGLQSEAEFMKTLKAQRAEQSTYDSAAKTSVAKWLTTDSNAGAMTKKEFEVVKDIPKADMLKQGLLEVEKSGATGSKKLGMQKAILSKVEAVDKERQKQADTELKQAFKTLERITTQSDRKELAKYKAELNSRKDLTLLEKAKLATEKLKQEKYKKELYE